MQMKTAPTSEFSNLIGLVIFILT